MVLIYERTGEKQDMWSVSLNNLNYVFQSLVGELIVCSKWSTHDHHLNWLAFGEFVESLKFLLGENRLINRVNRWLPNSVYVELLGVHESFSNNYFSFKERKAWNFCKIESKSALAVISSVEKADSVLFHLWLLG